MSAKDITVIKGTGKKYIYCDINNRKVHIDFSGNEETVGGRVQCYRNDAAVFFSLANNYWNATLTIKEEIQRGFDSKDKNKVLSLIIPYLFNFRHFVELSIKALYMSSCGEQANISHEIKGLFRDLKDVLLNLERDDREGIFAISDEEYANAKEKIQKYLEQMENILIPYFDSEPSVEYYRFLFDKSNKLDFPIIDFDFDTQINIHKNYYDVYKSLIREIHRIHYIYDMA